MTKSLLMNIIAFAAGVSVYYGFRFVTQAGQGLDAVQNDGYGGTGGFMILAGGLVIGYIMGKSKK